MSALIARRALEKAIKAGGAWNGAHPKTLKLSEIRRWEELFQHRRPEEHRSRQHVRALAKIPGQMGRDLSPIRVWWAGDDRGWLCIDGHHRLAAYAAAGRTEPVPVEVFEGSPDEALLEALRGNTRDHLAMDAWEKLDAAWRIVVTVGTAQSRSTIAEAAGVSDRTIANMRAVAKKFSEQRPEQDPTEFSWRNAQLIVAGQDTPKGDAEAAREKKLKELSDALIQRFGPVMRRDTELFAEALRRCDPTLPGALQGVFEQWAREADEGQGEEEGSTADGLYLPFSVPSTDEAIF